MAGSQRPLLSGPLRQVPMQPTSISYTEKPITKDEVTIRRRDEKKIPVVEITYEDIPQPFLNPSIMQNRVRAEQEWKTAQDRLKKEGDQASSSC